jgi:hypothetical protein
MAVLRAVCTEARNLIFFHEEAGEYYKGMLGDWVYGWPFEGLLSLCKEYVTAKFDFGAVVYIAYWTSCQFTGGEEPPFQRFYCVCFLTFGHTSGWTYDKVENVSKYDVGPFFHAIMMDLDEIKGRVLYNFEDEDDLTRETVMYAVPMFEHSLRRWKNIVTGKEEAPSNPGQGPLYPRT